MGIFDYIILAVIVLAAAAAVVYMVKRKRQGKCIGCSGDCSQCGYRKK